MTSIPAQDATAELPLKAATVAAAASECQEVVIVTRTQDEKTGASTTSVAAAVAVEVDIDGVPIRDGKKIDLKQILGHMPQVDDDEDETSTADDKSTAAGGGSRRGVGQNFVEEGASAALLIQSQFEPVDYDDLEYGGASDLDDDYELEQGEDWVGSGRRKRRSSLKKLLRMASDHSTLPPEDPDSGGELSPEHSRSKAVRFADAVGLGLTDIRDLINSDEPPEVPASALRDLHIRRRKRSKLHVTYKLDFDQPGSDPCFIRRVLDDKVALENCIARTDMQAAGGGSTSSFDQLTISGVIRVANVAFDKQVLVRYTVDGWRKGATEYEVAASYLPGSNDGATDRFAFVMQPPPGSMLAAGNRLEFAVAFDAAGTIYWDSNRGANYGVDCCALQVSTESLGSGGETSPMSPVRGSVGISESSLS